MKKIIICLIAALMALAVVICVSAITPRDSQNPQSVFLTPPVLTENPDNPGVKGAYGEFPPATVGEIPLPPMGERVEYATEITLYEGVHGCPVTAYAAKRMDDRILFYTRATEYHYPMLYLNVLAADGTLYLGANSFQRKDGTYAYVLFAYNKQDNSYAASVDEIRNGLGETFVAEKDYYSIIGGWVEEAVPPETEAYTNEFLEPLVLKENPDNPGVKSAVIENGVPMSVHEILLPKTGERIEYTEEILLYEGVHDSPILAYAALREEDQIIFYTRESAYRYEILYLNVITAEDVVYTCTHPNRLADGTYCYVLERFELNTSLKDDVQTYLGYEYDTHQNYFTITGGWIEFTE